MKKVTVENKSLAIFYFAPSTISQSHFFMSEFIEVNFNYLIKKFHIKSLIFNYFSLIKYKILNRWILIQSC